MNPTHPITLTSSPVDLSHVKDAFAVVAPGVLPPFGCRVLSLDYVLMHIGELTGTMVTVGLSRMMTPTNRVKLGQAFLRPWPGLRRMSIDDRLFHVEPWRMWWHFFGAGINPWGYTDSFLAESRWKAATEYESDDPFSVEHVLSAMRDAVDVRRDAFSFGPVEYKTVEVSEDVKALYAAEKEAAFTDEKTHSGIIRRLAKVAQGAFKERFIPTPARMFSKPTRQVVATDLPVDRFLVGQLAAVVDLTNAIAEVGA